LQRFFGIWGKKMAETVNLKRSYALMNEKLAHQFDGSGVKRSFTVPYVGGQSTEDHVSAVGQAATQSGGLTGNLLTSAHHSSGKGWGSGEGQTTGHPAEKLRTTIIPKNDPHAKETIDAAQKHLNNIETLLGDKDPAVQTAQSQLNLVKRSDGAGMNLLDFGTFLTQIMYAPHQAVARAHSDAHPDGMAPHLRAPHGTPVPEGQETPAAPQGGEQTAEAAPTGQPGAPVAQAAPVAPQAQG
jgi:hypothetical protein